MLRTTLDRGFVRCALGDTVLLFGAAGEMDAAPPELATPAAKPDLLLVLADDLMWCDIGCYGSPQAQTPHIDRLAIERVRFDRAFAATAMCSPSRHQLYTGLYPVRNGAYPNQSQVYPGTKNRVHYFR